MVFGNLSQHLVDIRGTYDSVPSDGDCFSESSEAGSQVDSDDNNMERARSVSLVALESLDPDGEDSDDDKAKVGDSQEYNEAAATAGEDGSVDEEVVPEEANADVDAAETDKTVSAHSSSPPDDAVSTEEPSSTREEGQ